MKIYTENIPGNLHRAATIINKRGWAEHLVQMESNGGQYTVAVFKMPSAYVYEIRGRDPSFAGDIHHDDTVSGRSLDEKTT